MAESTPRNALGAYQLFKTSQFIRGWINYFCIANCYQFCADLDHWIQRRVRMSYWRLWRKPPTKLRSLMRLGVHVQVAVACGCQSASAYFQSQDGKWPGFHRLKPRPGVIYGWFWLPTVGRCLLVKVSRCLTCQVLSWKPWALTYRQWPSAQHRS